ncbi:hypothetical protein Sme01_19260 [Sphaerisporangium melleum]|uniref:Uncharacterized protein n=1 Tax=Sphaerisporangium melleum TaxID=321316 RepID=A0A917RET7_9ACTN|nr:hypothetical protein [Sphaerisporangium melleum]GGL03000.1 hypothetical protein GCM10007964_51380 [Sphaerisporangium melleum]GII69450.1 hypothetical protein Sme01_19260 [Sphaerisporangium melleum]
MTEFPLLVLLLGPVLLAEALLARHEVMSYTAGWRTPTNELPRGMPYARGADPDRPPAAYLVYLDGIGKRRFHDTRDGGQLVKAVIAGAPELRVLGQVQPYSPLADPLSDRPLWAWLRRHAGLSLFLHNVMQIFVAADHRYRPLYNRAVGAQIAGQLRLAGYRPGSGIPVVLLSYSGGAQAATGAVGELYARLRAPLLLITLGGFHNGANDLRHAHHLHRLTSDGDWIERSSVWIFPQRWRLLRRSPWNQAERAGKITVHRLDPATHLGRRSYISPDAWLPDGRSHLGHTADTVIALVRTYCGALEDGAPRPPAQGRRASRPLRDRVRTRAGVGRWVRGVREPEEGRGK